MVIVCVFLVVAILCLSYLSYIERKRLTDLLVSKNVKDFFLMQTDTPKQDKNKEELDGTGFSDLQEALLEKQREDNL